jgi:tetratricopeptide (TPR) repeat protein
MNRLPRFARQLGPSAIVIVATILAYLPALRGEFIWNDSDYVTEPALRSLAGLGRIWGDVGATEQYYPLLHSAFWVQQRVFGDRPLGYHLVGLALHILSALLFAAVLRRLFSPTGYASPAADARPAFSGELAAWIAALLFALHPVHVESVAWIAEQKNTLSLAFYLGAALAYLRFDETRRPAPYAAGLVLFAASLGCKTVTATLPAALLVALWWKRGRLDPRRDVAPLLPWLAAGMAAGLFSSWVERVYGHAVGPDFTTSPAGRLLVAGRSIAFYAGKLSWPAGLNFIYPRWIIDPADARQWLYPAGVALFGAALWWLRGRWRGPLAAFLFFTGSLFPVLGFVNLYGARFSWVWDHWQYLADLGPIAFAAAVLASAWRRLKGGSRFLGAALFGILLAAFGALDPAHARMFHDDQTLYRATIARNPGCWMAHYNLGLIWSQAPGRLDDAIAEFRESIRLKPDLAEAHDNLGTALMRTPRGLKDAIAEYREAIRLDPNAYRPHYNLGFVWSHLPGHIDEAVDEYEIAVRLQPNSVKSRDNLGVALARIPGRQDEAIEQFRAALRLDPSYAGAHNNLGFALSQRAERLPEAVAEYRSAIRLDPGFGLAWYNLGAALFQLGSLKEAEDAFREELRLSPDDPNGRKALAVVRQRLGEN